MCGLDKTLESGTRLVFENAYINTLHIAMPVEHIHIVHDHDDAGFWSMVNMVTTNKAPKNARGATHTDKIMPGAVFEKMGAVFWINEGGF